MCFGGGGGGDVRQTTTVQLPAPTAEETEARQLALEALRIRQAMIPSLLQSIGLGLPPSAATAPPGPSSPPLPPGGTAPPNPPTGTIPLNPPTSTTPLLPGQTRTHFLGGQGAPLPNAPISVPPAPPSSFAGSGFGAFNWPQSGGPSTIPSLSQGSTPFPIQGVTPSTRPPTSQNLSGLGGLNALQLQQLPPTPQQEQLNALRSSSLGGANDAVQILLERLRLAQTLLPGLLSSVQQQVRPTTYWPPWERW